MGVQAVRGLPATLPPRLASSTAVLHTSNAPEAIRRGPKLHVDAHAASKPGVGPAKAQSVCIRDYQ